MSIDDSLPTDLASAHALIIAQRQALIAAQSEAQLPLNRQSTTYGREGIDLDVSTLADWVGRRRQR
jgi:hypothetical protein